MTKFWAHKFVTMKIGNGCMKCGRVEDHKLHRPPFWNPRINWEKLFK